MVFSTIKYNPDWTKMIARLCILRGYFFFSMSEEARNSGTWIFRTFDKYQYTSDEEERWEAGKQWEKDRLRKQMRKDRFGEKNKTYINVLFLQKSRH